MPRQSDRFPRPVANVIAATWLAIAALTSWLLALEVNERTVLANLLRVAIVVLMVITAFLLIRYDLIRRK